MTSTSNNDWNFLSKVYQMLVDEGFINTKPDDELVRFKYPHELQVSCNVL